MSMMLSRYDANLNDFSPFRLRALGSAKSKRFGNNQLQLDVKMAAILKLVLAVAVVGVSSQRQKMVNSHSPEPAKALTPVLADSILE